MKKVLKITGIVILSILILMFTLPFIFKGKITELVKKEVNNTLTADVTFQKIGINLFTNFPHLSVNIKEISVVGRESFKGDTLAYIQKLSLAVNVLSVFGEKGIEVSKISIDRPIANLLIDKEGNTNWDIVKPSDKPEEKKKPEEVSESSFKLTLKSLTLSKGKIVYHDKKGKMKLITNDLNLALSGNFSAELETLKLKLGITKTTFIMGSVPYLSNAKINFKGEIEADLKNNKYSFKKNILKINALELYFSGWLALLKDDMDMDLSLQLVKADFKHILSLIPALYSKDFSDIQAEGKLAFAAKAKGKMTKTTYPAFDAKLQIENAKFKYPSLPKVVENIQVNTHIYSTGGVLDNAVVDLKKLHVEMCGNPLDIYLLLKKPISNPTFDFAAKGVINLTAVKDFYPLDNSTDIAGVLKMNVTAKGDLKSIDSKHYENVNLTGLVDLTGGKLKSDMTNDVLQIENLQLDFSQRHANMTTAAKVGKNDIKAVGKLENFVAYILKDDVIKGQLNVSSNYLNINTLMKDNSANEKSKKEENKAESSPMSVIEIPKNIDFLLNLNIKHLIYDNFDLKQVSGSATVKNQILDMKNLSMKTLGGDFKLAGAYKVQNPKRPEVNMSMNLYNVDVQETAKTFMTLKNLLPIAEKTTGYISMNLDMKTYLDQTMTPDYKTLNATGNISSTGVKIEGVEVLDKMADALKINKLKKISLNQFKFNFKSVNGRVTTEPFDVKVGNMNATIFGSSGLDETIDYTINSKIPRSELGSEANSVISKLGSNMGGTGINVTLPEIIQLPIGIGGTFTKPVIKLGALGNTGKEIVQDVAEQIVTQGKEIVNDQINKAVEEAKKQAGKLIADATKQKENLVKQARDAGNKLVTEADKQGQELVKKAGSNLITKKAAEESAKKLKQEAQKQSDNLVKEAENQGDNLIAQAKKNGNDLIKKAEEKKL